jgi:hypothetical protein
VGRQRFVSIEGVKCIVALKGADAP